MDDTTDKKSTVKARSCHCDPYKRKSFNFNDAVQSLDLALCRLKKSKFVSKDSLGGRSNDISNSMDMFIDSGSMITSHSRYGRKFDKNSSALSLNFSQCEMIRNVSRTDCLSEGAYSGNTCDSNIAPADLTLKDEQLEKYFKSIDKWSQQINKSPYHELRTNVPEE